MNKKNILIAATVLGLFASSCRKDVYNAKRLEGSWTIEEYKVDGRDLLADSTTISFGGQTAKFKFSSASIIFEEDGDFTEYINGGVSISYSYGGYSYSYSQPFSTSPTGVWEGLEDDLLMTFEPDTLNNYGSPFAYSSPANSGLITGNIYSYSYDFTEQFDILKLTKSSLEMQTLNSSGQVVFVKASKL